MNTTKTEAWNKYFLNLLQKELDNYLDSFREDITKLNNQRTTRRNIKEITNSFSQRMKGILDTKESRLDNNNKLPRDFYWKNSSTFILESIKATQTPIGKFILETNPKFKRNVQDKIIYFCKESDNPKMEDIPEVQRLRVYCRDFY